VLNTAGYTALTFALGGIAAWMPKYVSVFRYQDTTPERLAEVNTVFGLIVVISGLIGTLVGGWGGDALRGRLRGAYFLVSGVAMLFAFPLLVATLYTPFPFAWGLISLCCFCLFFSTGPINTILANVAHPSVRATGCALDVPISHAFGAVISPPIMGFISD